MNAEAPVVPTCRSKQLAVGMLFLCIAVAFAVVLIAVTPHSSFAGETGDAGSVPIVGDEAQVEGFREDVSAANGDADVPSEAFASASEAASSPSADVDGASEGPAGLSASDTVPDAGAGPFVVEGPEDSFAWDGDALSITGEGVTIVGMADPSSAISANVEVASEVSEVGLGSGVRIQTLSTAGGTTVRLDGDGNEVDRWNMESGLGVSGSGSLSVGEAAAAIDILSGATVSVEGDAAGVSIRDGGTLSVGPRAALSNIAQLGGTLDLSRVVFGAPVRVLGYSVGGEGVSSVIFAPFGATLLTELMTYDHLFANGGDTAVVEDGERVGALQDDGSFEITATRTATFVGFHGVVLSTQKVKLFSAAEAPSVETPDGYSFVGWDRPFDRVTEDETVSARFEKLPDATSQASGRDPGDATRQGGIGGTVSITTSDPSADASTGSRQPQRVSPGNRLARTGDGSSLPAAFVAVSAAAALAIGVAALRRR